MAKKTRPPVTIVQMSGSTRDKVRDIVIRKLSDRVLEEGLNRCGPKVTEERLLSHVDETMAQLLNSIFSDKQVDDGEGSVGYGELKGKVLSILCKLGKDQGDLAKASGLHRVTIYRIGAGSGNFKLVTFKKLCEGLTALGAPDSDIKDLQKLANALEIK
ncbi:hypothetical protein GF318_04025 [Candidatus Micrarchaeota archaeon]|nr:hypothetical protein [Candidatus Micrarchaeota archaeon]